MSRTDFITDEAQLAAFAEAVDELGGKAETARLLGVHERTVRDLLPGGRRKLHTGFMRDVSEQLIAKADRCRALERRLNPAFGRNLTADQAAGEDGRTLRYDRQRRDGAQAASGSAAGGSDG